MKIQSSVITRSSYKARVYQFEYCSQCVDALILPVLLINLKSMLFSRWQGSYVS